MSRTHVAAALCTSFLLSLGCAGMSSDAMPTTAWSQSAVTQLASQLASELQTLYTTAYKEPELTGEQAAEQSTLNDLRILSEGASGLAKDLSDGKTMADTRDHFEHIQEIARDLQVSDSWEYLPKRFTSQADTAFSLIKQLDAYYGTR